MKYEIQQNNIKCIVAKQLTVHYVFYVLDNKATFWIP